jgi:hypothetical protein
MGERGQDVGEKSPYIRWNDPEDEYVVEVVSSNEETTEGFNTPFGFLTDLYCVKIKEARSNNRALWKLTQEFRYNSPIYGLIIVPTGFITDFASVPRLPFAYWLTGDTAHASAVVHDWLCRFDYMQHKVSWAKAADVFYEAMEYEGTPSWRRLMMKLGVKLAPNKRLSYEEYIRNEMRSQMELSIPEVEDDLTFATIKD